MTAARRGIPKREPSKNSKQSEAALSPIRDASLPAGLPSTMGDGIDRERARTATPPTPLPAALPTRTHVSGLRARVTSKVRRGSGDGRTATALRR
jgi:hypothetical protein